MVVPLAVHPRSIARQLSEIDLGINFHTDMEQDLQ